MTVIVDGRRADSIDGLHVGFAQRLAGNPNPVGCCDCGGPAPLGSRLTRIDRNLGRGAGTSLGVAAWRRCSDCVALRKAGMGALVRDALEVHGIGPAEHAPVEVISAALQVNGLVFWHSVAPSREEFSIPCAGRWEFGAAAQWASGFRDYVGRRMAATGGVQWAR